MASSHMALLHLPSLAGLDKVSQPSAARYAGANAALRYQWLDLDVEDHNSLQSYTVLKCTLETVATSCAGKYTSFMFCLHVDHLKWSPFDLFSPF